MATPLRRGDAPLLPHQLDVVADRVSSVKVMTGGYRSAKTVTGVACAVDMGFRGIALGDSVDGLVVGPTFRFVNDVIVRNFKTFLTRWHIPHVYHKTDKILTVGRRRRFDIFCRSADDPRAIEGVTAGWLWGDEWELWAPEALTTAFGRVSKGQVMQRLLTGTPEGFGPNSKAVLGEVPLQVVRRHMKKDDDGKEVEHYRVLKSADGLLTQWIVASHANTTLPPGYVAGMRKHLDADGADEKLLGERRAKGGRVYSRFDRALHSAQACVTPGEGRVQVWADFNWGHMVWVVVEVDEHARAAHIVGELIGKDTDTAAQAEQMKTYLAAYLTRTRRRQTTPEDVRYMRIPVWCDATATQHTAVTPITHAVIIRQAGFEPQHGARNPLIDDRVNTVQIMLRDMRLTVDADRAPTTTASFERQVWVDGKPDKSGGIDAPMDAVGYGCWWQFPVWRRPDQRDPRGRGNAARP